ncbi:hypothetical protein [Orlajensenia flava]|uniref:hypothetical protein n=1 Tax=Orlajensenia flava TaxID=2565934 RepID=UPI001455A1B4|nr:hypothetical protein [Glaciibacter flavus]
MKAPFRQTAIAVAALAALLLTGCTGTPGSSTSHLSTSRPTSTATPKKTTAPTPTPGATAGATPGATPGAQPGAQPGTGGGGGQSKADACGIMNDVVTRASDLNDSGSDALGDDPAAAVSALDTLSQQFGTAAGQVSNSEVKPAADAVAKSAVTYFGSIKSYATDPSSIDPTALSDQVVDFGNQMDALQNVCGG